MEFVLALLPIAMLIVFLLVFKVSASKAGALSFLACILVAYFVFKVDINGLAISTGKGIALSLNVILILWAAIFLYHLVEEFGALDVITQNLVRFVKDPFIQFFLIAFLFSSALQGIAGFGVPVLITVPILITLGFDKMKSITAVLLGHSWSISFGSMGSSFNAIKLVAGLEPQKLAFAMSIFDILTMILCAMFVVYIYGGFNQIIKTFKYTIPTLIVMTICMLLTISIGSTSLIALITSLSGVIVMLTINVYKNKKKKIKYKPYKTKLSLMESLIPYTSIIVLSILFQFISFDLAISFDFPGYETGLEYIVKESLNYASLNLLTHPTPIMMISALLAISTYFRKGILNSKKLKKVLDKTIKKGVNNILSLAYLIMMAINLTDSGMTTNIAQNIANMAGSYYPIFCPLLGVLGSFITGSNTNSNVIFGELQYNIANNLHMDPYIMCGNQSIGGAIGAGTGPNTTLMGTNSASMSGEESKIYAATLKYTFATALIIGVMNYIILSALQMTL